MSITRNALLLLTSGILLANLPVPLRAQTLPSFDTAARPADATPTSEATDESSTDKKLLSRAELASILVETFDLERRVPTNSTKVVLQDVLPSHWAHDNIQIVLRTGTMSGYRAGLFYPNQRITRAEAFAIFAQAYGVFQFPDATVNRILKDYPDWQKIPTWARKAMATALNERFVNTDANNRINPLEPMTRADMNYALAQWVERQENQAPVLR